MGVLWLQGMLAVTVVGMVILPLHVAFANVVNNDCSSLTISSSTISAADYTQIDWSNCSISVFQVVVDACSSGRFMSQIKINGTSFTGGATLKISGYTAIPFNNSEAHSLNSTEIIINHATFDSGTSFTLAGYFPPSSTIDVTGCRFTYIDTKLEQVETINLLGLRLGRECRLYLVNNAFIYEISPYSDFDGFAFYFARIDVMLDSKAALFIEGNHFTAFLHRTTPPNCATIILDSQHIIVVGMSFTELILLNESSVLCANNTFEIQITNGFEQFRAHFLELANGLSSSSQFIMHSGSSFMIANNVIDCVSATSRAATTLLLMYGDASVEIANSSWTFLNNLITAILPAPNEVMHISFWTNQFWLSEGSTFFLSQNRLCVQPTLSLCPSQLDVVYRTIAVLITLSGGDNSTLVSMASIVVSNNSLVHDYWSDNASTTTDQILSPMEFSTVLAHFVSNNLTTIGGSSILVSHNSISSFGWSWMVKMAPHLQPMLWASQRSSFVVTNNDIDVKANQTNGSAFVVDLGSVESTTVTFSSVLVIVADNTISVSSGVDVRTMSAIAVNLQTKSFLFSNSTLIIARNQIDMKVSSSAIATQSAIVSQTSFEAQVYSNTPAMFDPTVPSYTRYSILSNRLGSGGGPSIIRISSNTIDVRFNRTLADPGSLGQAVDNHTLTKMNIFVIFGSSWELLGNRLQLAGVAGGATFTLADMEDFSMASSSRFSITNNEIDLDIRSASALTTVIIKAMYGPRVTQSTLQIASNRVHSNTTMHMSSPEAFSDSVLFSPIVFPYYFWLSYANVSISRNTIVSVQRKSPSPGVLLPLNISFALVTVSSWLRFISGKISFISNDITVITGGPPLAGIHLMYPSGAPDVAVTSIDMFVCDNNVNGNYSVFDDRSLNLAGFTPLANINYEVCSKTAKISISQTVHRHPSVSLSGNSSHTDSKNSVSSSMIPSSSSSAAAITDSPSNKMSRSMSEVQVNSATLPICSEAALCSGLKISGGSIANATDFCKDDGLAQTVYNSTLKADAFLPLSAIRGNTTYLEGRYQSYFHDNVSVDGFALVSILVSDVSDSSVTCPRLTIDAIPPLIVLGTRTHLPALGCWIDAALPIIQVATGRDATAVTGGSGYGLAIRVAVPCLSGPELPSVLINQTIALEIPVRHMTPPAPVTVAAVISPVAATTTTVTGVVSIIGGGVIVPVAAMQQGIALALVRMANCEDDALDGEPLDVLVHPLRFPIGDGVTSYARGAIVGNLLLLPLLWGCLAYLPIPFLISKITRKTIQSARNTVGWPSALFIPYGMLAEGSTMAAVALTFTAGNSAGDIALGVIGIVVLIASLGLWLYALQRHLPRPIHLKRMKRRGLLSFVIDTRWEWIIKKACSREDEEEEEENSNSSSLQRSFVREYGLIIDKESIMLRYNHCFGEFWWLWSSVAGYAFSLLVGLAEGMPNDTDALCSARWALACLGAVLQSLSVLSCTIPLQLFLLGATGALICVLAGLVAVSTFRGGDMGESTRDAINTVGTINGFIGIALMVLGVLRLLFEFYGTRVKNGRPSRHRALSTSNVRLDEEMSSTDSPLSLSFARHSNLQDGPYSPHTNRQNSTPPQQPPQDFVVSGGSLTDYTKMPQHWRSILEEADEMDNTTVLHAKENRFGM